MSTLTVKVCEECGKQSVQGDGWLVIADIDIRSMSTDRSLMRAEQSIAICSPGCLLRYISRELEPAMNAHAHIHQPDAPEHLAKHDIRMVI